MPTELRAVHDTFHIPLLDRFDPDKFKRDAESPAQDLTRNYINFHELLNSDQMFTVVLWIYGCQAKCVRPYS